MHALTGGNPFFVSEVLRGERDQLPASARDAVLARAARLSAAGRDVLDAAALVGERVEPALLAADHRCRRLGARRAGRRRTAGRRGRHAPVPARDRPRAVEQEVGPHTAAEVHRRILAELEASGIDDDARLAHHAEGALDADAVPCATPDAPATGRPSSPRARGGDASTAAPSGSSPPTSRWSGPSCSTSSATSSPRWTSRRPAAARSWRSRSPCGGRPGRAPARGRRAATDRLSPTTALCRGPEAWRRPRRRSTCWSPLGPSPSWPGRCRGRQTATMMAEEQDLASDLRPRAPWRSPRRSTSRDVR